MAYDKAKAHEYYEKYRKKGMKKGRKHNKLTPNPNAGKKKKKATKKKTTAKKQPTVSLVGLSTSGLNEKGAFEANLIKEKVKKEMNAALQKAGSDEEKENIRREYQAKASEAINVLKSNAEYAKPKAEKKTKATGAQKEKKTTTTTQASNKKPLNESSASINAETAERLKNIESMLANLDEKLSKLSDERREEVTTELKGLLDLLKKFKSKAVSVNLEDEDGQSEEEN